MSCINKILEENSIFSVIGILRNWRNSKEIS